MSSDSFKVNEFLNVTASSKEEQSILRVSDTRTVPPFRAQVIVYSKHPTSIVIKADDYIIVDEEASATL